MLAHARRNNQIVALLLLDLDRFKEVNDTHGHLAGSRVLKEVADILRRLFIGVKAVLAVSIERIHAANLINFGIMPLIFEDPSDYSRISQGDKIVVRGVRAGLAPGTGWDGVRGHSGRVRPSRIFSGASSPCSVPSCLSPRSSRRCWGA